MPHDQHQEQASDQYRDNLQCDLICEKSCKNTPKVSRGFWTGKIDYKAAFELVGGNRIRVCPIGELVIPVDLSSLTPMYMK